MYLKVLSFDVANRQRGSFRSRVQRTDYIYISENAVNFSFQNIHHSRDFSIYAERASKGFNLFYWFPKLFCHSCNIFISCSSLSSSSSVAWVERGLKTKFLCWKRRKEISAMRHLQVAALSGILNVWS